MLERPGWMMNLAKNHSIRIQCGEQAVPLGEPIIERAWSSSINRSGWSIVGAELRACRVLVAADAVITNNIRHRFDFHARIVIGQAKPPRHSDGNPTRRVETEKPHAAFACCFDISSDVELR